MNSVLHILPVIIAFFLTACKSIKITNFTVPKVVNERSDVTLTCQYALQGTSLYAAKWYKDNQEFYRFMPREVPQEQFFHVAGLKVDVMRSNDKSVTIEHLDVDDGGNYRCEVSGEYPYFKTDVADKFMDVIALPDASPIITGGKDSYHVGNTIDVNCTSHRTKPPLSLAWTINGRPAPEKFIKNYKYTEDTKGKVKMTSNLKFEAYEGMFVRGKMSLTCTAVPEKVFKETPEPFLVASYSRSSDFVLSRVEDGDSSEGHVTTSEVGLFKVLMYISFIFLIR